MPEALAATPASANFQKLKDKLSELFELDKADLDFGIYRVLRQRHREIEEFLEKQLETTVREALRSHQTVQTEQVADELAKAEAAAKGAGITPDQSPRVLELREKLKVAGDVEAVADEVYSHLYTFFSRYYEEGDFLGLHRSTVQGRERYMIPYNGEEVKLVWANMDQFYIKSSELLRDYTFVIKKADWVAAQAELPLGDLPDEVRVHFKLTEGDTEKDNRKASGKTARAFALAEPAVEERDGALWIRFAYREHPAERNLQDKLNADTLKTLADTLTGPWKTLLLAADPTHQPKDKKDVRSVLQKHLRVYTARHQFDYFIHKDLGGFLRRELDFYLKNEVMHLDDIEGMGAPKAEEYLSKLRAIRRCASPVIRMLAQLEDFQKKLWLKKKFVVETRYCLTLDRVPEELYPEICQNDSQWQEWEELYKISELKPKRTVEFLGANKNLVIDTKHFTSAFRHALLASYEALDDGFSGLCVNADNFQALQLVSQCLGETAKSIYIDPPYNTGASAILYKNSYKHSSWGTLMLDRILRLRDLLSAKGVIFVSIDKIERTLLEACLDTAFGRDNRIEELIWTQNTANGQLPTYSTNHEYVEAYAKDRGAVEADGTLFREQKPGYPEIMDIVVRLNPEYPPLHEVEAAIKNLFKTHIAQLREDIEASGEEWSDEAAKQDPWKGIYNYCHAEYRDEAGALVPEADARQKRAKIWIWREISPSAPAAKQSPSTKDTNDHNFRYYRPLHPITKKPCPHPKGGWKFPLLPDPDNPDRKSFTQLEADNRIAWGEDEKKVPQTKGFLHEVETNISTSVFYEYNDGEAEVSSLFNKTGLFLAPKSSIFVKRFINQTIRHDGELFIDCFGGSGSSAHAAIDFTRDTSKKLRYLTCEVGKHFEELIVPRLKRVVYSRAWKEGKPQSRDTGISHAFKILRLESYEDTLNNLVLSRSPDQEAALKQQGAREQAEYMLGYFLDVESAGSAGLLNIAEFSDPFAYKLKIATSSAGETKETLVDLVETFNWLLGLKVRHIDTLPGGFVTVTGERRDGKKVLVVWRKLGADAAADNAALQRLFDKLQINPAETSDTDYAAIYVNGPHTLADPHGKIHLTEEEFHRRMFATEEFAGLE
jgi:adenine-specific DNA-methyltransferase